jgi:anti-sigma regulatory factor (Ser/Thr protein kinase)
MKKTVRTFSTQSQSLSEVYQWTKAWCCALNLRKPILDAFLLAVYEAACNVVEHAYKNVETTDGFVITLASSNKAAVALMEDHAQLFDINSVSPPDFSKQIKERPIGGLGVYFIRSLMDRVLTRRKDNINQLIMIKYLSASAETANQ